MECKNGYVYLQKNNERFFCRVKDDLCEERSFNDQFEMNASSFVLDAIAMIDVLCIGSAFDIDQDVRFDLLEIDEDQWTPITILIEKGKEVPMESSDSRVVQLRIVFDFIHEVTVNVILSSTLNQDVVGKVTLPQS